MKKKTINVSFNLNISKDSLVAILLAIALFFLLFDALQFVYSDSISRKLGKIIDITSEGNLPTLFSSLLAIMAGVTSYTISKEYDFIRSRKNKVSWLLIAVFFIYLGVDDSSQIHESIATALTDNLQNTNSGSWFSTSFLSFESYYWQLLYLPVFSVFGLYMLAYLRKEFYESKIFMTFVMGIACYIVAVILDYIDGVPAYYDLLINDSFSFSELQHTARALEEYLEMVGNSLILIAFLSHTSNLQRKN